jgi:hypothetical protein
VLGVLLIGMFTERCGSDAGNIIAISAGLLATVIVGKLDVMIVNGVASLFGRPPGRSGLDGRARETETSATVSEFRGPSAQG